MNFIKYYIHSLHITSHSLLLQLTKTNKLSSISKIFAIFIQASSTIPHGETKIHNNRPPW